MKILASATRLDTTDPVNYPDGQIKDATTSTAKDGTLLNKILLADIRTFFSYCVRKAGITANDNFDTVNNSQIADAVTAVVTGDSGWEEVTDFETGNSTGSDASFGKLRVRLLNNMVYITGSYNEAGTGNGFTLPVGFRHNNSVEYRYIQANRNFTTEGWPFEINTDGRCYIPGGIGAGTYYFNSFFPIDPTI